MSFDVFLRLPLAIPIWDQYVDFLKFVLENIGDRVGSGGLAIIIFTIIVRTLILPVTIRSTKSMKSMQDIQPKIKELQKKHKGDRAKVQQETMALYQMYGVNPIAGCLPALIQIPIFFGVYRAILGLSNSDAGVWHGGFMWLGSLKDPDPWHLLPVLAGIFQFVQTFMARPANQGKITDPQQAMMNTMMNIMPITVVLFGWGFASGPVIYWVTQSIYGIIQQWFITGWGKLNDYIPGLPEMPEHKRLGYHPPRDFDNFDPASVPVKKKGPLGKWWSKQMEQAQAISKERQGATAGAGASPRSSTASTSSATGTAAARRTTKPKTDRPYARNSPKGRMLADQARREPDEEVIEADFSTPEDLAPDIAADGTRNVTPRRARRARK